KEIVDAVIIAAMGAGDDPLEQLRVGCHAYLDAVLDPAVQRVCAVDGPAVLSDEIRQEITDRYALGVVREALIRAVAEGRLDDVTWRANATLDRKEREMSATREEKLAMEQQRGDDIDAELDAVRKRIEGGAS